MPCAAAGARCSAPGPSTTAAHAGSTRRAWTSRSSSRGRSRPHASGVMFTADPSTGDLGKLVIEGSFGLGEAVVSGQVSPDRYIVDKATLRVLAREVHNKELVIEPSADGGTVTRPTTRAGGAPGGALRRRGGRGRRARVARSNSTTARRRTPNGPLTPTASSGCCRAGRSRRSARIPRPEAAAALAGAKRAAGTVLAARTRRRSGLRQRRGAHPHHARRRRQACQR